MIECILTDALFLDTFISGAIIGCTAGVVIMCIIMCIVSINRYKDPHKDVLSTMPPDERFIYSADGKKLMACTEEDLHDPVFMDKAHKLLNGADNAA